MRVLVTGARGTIGGVLCRHLGERGDQVVAWDRDRVDIFDRAAVREHVRAVAPDALVHLAVASQPRGVDNEGWRVNVEWTRELALASRDQGGKLLFTSSAMVFSNDAVGPFRCDSEPDAAAGYGHEKRVCEGWLADNHPDAVIARLGWQIGEAPGSNNMIDYLDSHHRADGRVAASRRWLPACSLVDDTVAALLWLLDQSSRGLYMLDSNREHSFFAIASALSRLHGDRWNVVADDSFVYDQRLVDERVPMPALSERLPSLAG